MVRIAAFLSIALASVPPSEKLDEAFASMKADVDARMAADTAKMEARIKELEDRLKDVGTMKAHERRLYNEVLSARSFSLARVGV